MGESASGGIAGGEVALCGGVCEPPPRILRKPFILKGCKVLREATASWMILRQKIDIIGTRNKDLLITVLSTLDTSKGSLRSGCQVVIRVKKRTEALDNGVTDDRHR